eukprot:5599661-Prymnesium_polylepis.1
MIPRADDDARRGAALSRVVAALLGVRTGGGLRSGGRCRARAWGARIDKRRVWEGFFRSIMRKFAGFFVNFAIGAAREIQRPLLAAEPEHEKHRLARARRT